MQQLFLVIVFCIFLINQSEASICVRLGADNEGLVTMDVRLAYRDDLLSEWTEMAHSIEHRKLNCSFTTTKVNTNNLWP